MKYWLAHRLDWLTRHRIRRLCLWIDLQDPELLAEFARPVTNPGPPFPIPPRVRIENGHTSTSNT